MSTRPLLTDPDHIEDLAELRRKVERLQDELADARLKIQEERNRSAKALRVQARLRDQLAPLYRALNGVMEDLPDAEAETTSAGTPAQSSKWEAWKQQFPGRPAEIIDLILRLGPMNTTQLATAARRDPRTITQAIHVLNKAGIIEKNGGVFSLRSS